MKYIFFIFLTHLVINAAYIGDNACQSCHEKEHKEWQGSHHDLAMQHAKAKTVLGNFNNTTFDYNGITTSFYKKDSKFMVRTDDANGKLHDYEISYTFGVYPLQQYMVKFPKGHIQVLDIAWDSRTKKEGGQRWFHLHKNDNIVAGDVLHWTGQNLNWNFMCADCHSTNLKKNYNAKDRSYNTEYDIINVSCEACHGPGSEHTIWAKKPSTYAGTLKKGFSIDFSSSGKDRWKIDKESAKAVLIGEIDHTEVELCAKCHARRSQLDDDFVPGERFEEHYRPVTLTQRLYFSDGKIKDEVYVYSSFRQSKMYEAGVICSDCHNPHSLKRYGVGDNVCNKCHLQRDYDSPKHTRHENSAGCIDCHMPSRTYMGVDERNDHSFRIPRPDLSVGSDIPNACNNCHKNKDAIWASSVMKKWYGKIPVGKQNFAHSLQSLHSNNDDALTTLYAVLMSDAPDIAKATAVDYIGHYPSKKTYMTTIQMLQNRDGNIRLNALKSLESFPLNLRLKKTFEILDDPLKSVRIEAARQLSSIPKGELDKEAHNKLQKGINEYKASLLFNAERPESQTALAKLYTNLNQHSKAKQAYKEAIYLQPQYIPAYINYAHYLQTIKNEKKSFNILQEGLKAVPKAAALHHSLGLWHIRHKELAKGLEALKKAAKLNKSNSRYQYVYAVALSAKNLPKAIEVLDNSLKKHTGDIQTLFALAYYHQQLGHTMQAELYKKKAEDLSRFNPNFLRK